MKDDKSRIRHIISKKKKRKITIENSGPENREPLRRVSLPGVPVIIRKGAMTQLSEITKTPNLRIGNAAQQFLEAKESENSVQILTNALGGCRLKITTAARQGSEDIQRCADFPGEYVRWEMKSRRYDFCRQVWGGIHNHMAELIQVVGPNVHQDVLA